MDNKKENNERNNEKPSEDPFENWRLASVRHRNNDMGIVIGNSREVNFNNNSIENVLNHNIDSNIKNTIKELQESVINLRDNLEY